MTSPILLDFDPSAPTEVCTDTSARGMNTVLAQHQRDQACVIAYAGRLLSSPECNYLITKHECLALVRAVMIFRPYMFGGRFQWSPIITLYVGSLH